MKTKDRFRLPADPAARQRAFEHYEREKCSKKRKYIDKGTAECKAEQYFIEGTNHSGRMPKNLLVPYQCPWCKSWHLKTERNS